MSLAHNLTRRHGFTLVEVLVALAILAIALAATSRAASTATSTAMEAKKRTLAMWVAQNRTAELVARRAFPSAEGRETGNTEMGGVRFAWSQRVATSPNPLFRKVVVDVREEASGDERALASLSVYLLNPSP